MKKYELMFVAKVEEEAIIASNIEKVKNWIVENTGYIDDVELWGKKRLAYAIQDYKEGYYVLIKFHTDVINTVKELDRRLRINDFCLRHMIISQF